MKIVKVIFSIFIFISSHTVYAQTLSRPFIVAHSMHYKDGVDLTKFGVPQNPIIYESTLLPRMDSDELYSDSALKGFAAKLKKGPLPTVIDIERWSIYTKDKTKRAETLRKLLNVLEKLRAVRPDIDFGYYDVAPLHKYWTFSSAKDEEERSEWHQFNQMAKGDFVPYVDAIFPSLYTTYNDPQKWKLNAIEILQSARSFNKPVYCYLWPQYHFAKQRKQGEYLSAEYWKAQLETCRNYSDGIVIWNYEPDKPWDDNAPWWKETVTFLKSLDRDRVSQ